MRVLKINLNNFGREILNIDEKNINGYLDLSIYLYLKYENEDPIIFFPSLYKYKWEGGVLFKSPITNNLIFDFVGELGHYIKSAGFDAIIFSNKSDKKYFVLIENDSVLFLDDSINYDLIKKSEEFNNNLKNYYGEKDYISFFNSIGSLYTTYGSLYSIRNIENKIKIHSLGYGIGTKLLNKNITGFSIYGDNKVIYNQEEKLLLNINEDNIRKTYEENKYNLSYFNYQNIYLDKNEFEKFYEKMVLDLLLKENVDKYNFTTLHSLGPFLGIFDIKYIEELNNLIIKYGLDLKYTSYVLAMVAEAFYKNLINIKDLEKISFDIKNYENIDYERNFNFYKNILEKISLGELTILGKNIKNISRELNLNYISVYIDIGKDKDIVPFYFISYGLIFPQFLYNKDFTNYSFIYEEPDKYSEICRNIFLEKYHINNIGEKRLKFEEIKDVELYWIYKLYQYNFENGYIPEFFTSKRILDIIKYVQKFYNKDFDIKNYFYIWYNKYFSF